MITKIIRFYGMISGCCFMFHFRLLEKIGMWDENIYLNHEEDAIVAKLYAFRSTMRSCS